MAPCWSPMTSPDRSTASVTRADTEARRALGAHTTRKRVRSVMSLLRAILYGLWRGLDGLRKFLHLLLLLVVFGFVVGALRVSMPSVPAKAALLVAPEGTLVEQLSGDPFERAIGEARGQGRSETLLWDLTD